MTLLAFSVALAAQAATPVQATSPATAPRSAKAKLICKRFEETGSLVKKRKVCHTAADWARLQQATQEEWSALQGILGNSRGN